jgi:hypothetical protein
MSALICACDRPQASVTRHFFSSCREMVPHSRVCKRVRRR